MWQQEGEMVTKNHRAGAVVLGDHAVVWRNEGELHHPTKCADDARRFPYKTAGSLD